VEKRPKIARAKDEQMAGEDREVETKKLTTVKTTGKLVKVAS